MVPRPVGIVMAARLEHVLLCGRGREYAAAMAKDLKLGLVLGYWFAGKPTGVAEQIRTAEELGFDSVWTAEAYGSDCFTPLAWYGAETTTLKLGTAVCQLSARTP